jgi:predicted SprT family Zn-dependent metalloprotease
MVSVASTEELVEVQDEYDDAEEESDEEDDAAPTTIGRGAQGQRRRQQALLSDDDDDDGGVGGEEDDRDDDYRPRAPSALRSSGGEDTADESDGPTSSSATTAADTDSTFGSPGADDVDASDGGSSEASSASTSSSLVEEEESDDELATPDGTPAKKQGKQKKGGKKGDAGRAEAPTTQTAPPLDDAPGGLAFARRRERLARELYAEWNAAVFDGRLPPDLPIVWNPRLRCTAGQVVDDRSQDALKTTTRVVSSAALSPRGSGGGNRRAPAAGGRSNERIPCRLELSPRVLDREARLRDTLAHEMAHVAAWAIDRDFERAHGATFHRWSRLFEARVPGIAITTRHSYGPAVPQCRWVCENAACARLYSRSKMSIDVRRHVCGACRGRLLFQGRFTADGGALLEAGPAAPPSSALKVKRPPNAFGLFVKEHYAEVKASSSSRLRHAEVMTLLSARWRAAKNAGGGGGGDDDEQEAEASAPALVGAFAARV